MNKFVYEVKIAKDPEKYLYSSLLKAIRSIADRTKQPFTEQEKRNIKDQIIKHGYSFDVVSQPWVFTIIERRLF
jgi:hypothetical protein